MLRKDKEIDLIEVTKEGDVFKLKMRNIREMIKDTNTTEMFFDNGCLVTRGSLDTKKTLYRISRIYGQTINYNPTGLNCDRIATWLMTGRLEWTTALFYNVDPPISLPTIPGQVNEGIINEIEEILSIW